MWHGIAWTTVLSLVFASNAQSDTAAHSIYRCETSTGLVFSDRPCSSEAQVYTPDLSGVSIVQTEVPQPTTGSAKAPKPQRTRMASKQSMPAKADQCERLNEALHKIASTLRSGYGAKQGERLKERKRELDAQRRAHKC
ncbi:MAG: hypothetical protein ACJ8MR_11020 [Povalibacter sp.]